MNVWRDAILADDYEAHMAGIGQAQANADLVVELLTVSPPPDGGRVWFAGAGTGQIFDYMDAEILRPWHTTFTDINPVFLERLAGRLRDRGLQFVTYVDNLEETRVTGRFDLAVVVLVLEHVDWRKAVESLSQHTSEGLFIVIQEDPAEFSEGRPAVGSMQVLRQMPSQRIGRGELTAVLEQYGWRLSRVSSREVADGKKMTGLEMRR